MELPSCINLNNSEHERGLADHKPRTTEELTSSTYTDMHRYLTPCAHSRRWGKCGARTRGRSGRIRDYFEGCRCDPITVQDRRCETVMGRLWVGVGGDEVDRLSTPTSADSIIKPQLVRPVRLHGHVRAPSTLLALNHRAGRMFAMRSGRLRRSSRACRWARRACGARCLARCLATGTAPPAVAASRPVPCFLPAGTTSWPGRPFSSRF